MKWHPTKGLLASGSKDNLVKFWDPRTSTVLTTLCAHLSDQTVLSRYSADLVGRMQTWTQEYDSSFTVVSKWSYGCDSFSRSTHQGV